MKPLAAGNWKMNGLASSLVEIESLSRSLPTLSCEVLVCPPATLLSRAADCVGPGMRLGGQDCHAGSAGAHTGDVSAAMLSDAGASHVILGHSERRTDHCETDTLIHAKVQAAWASRLIAIICVGESEAERDAGRTLDVIAGQIAGSMPEGAQAANTVVAYEPIWAIGTGRTPTVEQISEVHGFLRKTLVERFGAEGSGMRLLYGGSVKPSNAQEIFSVADVNGALVGGASLKAEDFGAIILALEETQGAGARESRG